MGGSCGKPACEARNAQDPPLDRAISELARRQHGVLALRQLAEVGLTADAARKRATAGRLHRVHSGVFAVVDPALLTRRGRFMAAVLACGRRAVLSHGSAAALHELAPSTGRRVHVSAPASRGRGRAGISVHSAATLAARDRTLIDDIPCTTPARTLLDVAEGGRRREVERALDRADTRRLLDMAAIDDVLSRANGRRGAALLTEVIADHRAGCTLTRNDLEEAFLQIGRHAALPPDAVNAWIPFPDGGGAEADFLWRAPRLIVEVDGRDVHTTRRAFETDRRRDQRLAVLGWRVVRFTWRQVVHEPAGVAATLRCLLSPGQPMVASRRAGATLPPCDRFSPGSC